MVYISVLKIDLNVSQFELFPDFKCNETIGSWKVFVSTIPWLSRSLRNKPLGQRPQRVWA